MISGQQSERINSTFDHFCCCSVELKTHFPPLVTQLHSHVSASVPASFIKMFDFVHCFVKSFCSGCQRVKESKQVFLLPSCTVLNITCGLRDSFKPPCSSCSSHLPIKPHNLLHVDAIKSPQQSHMSSGEHLLHMSSCTPTPPTSSCRQHEAGKSHLLLDAACLVYCNFTLFCFNCLISINLLQTEATFHQTRWES